MIPISLRPHNNSMGLLRLGTTIKVTIQIADILPILPRRNRAMEPHNNTDMAIHTSNSSIIMGNPARPVVLVDLRASVDLGLLSLEEQPAGF